MRLEGKKEIRKEVRRYGGKEDISVAQFTHKRQHKVGRKGGGKEALKGNNEIGKERRTQARKN